MLALQVILFSFVLFSYAFAAHLTDAYKPRFSVLKARRPLASSEDSVESLPDFSALETAVWTKIFTMIDPLDVVNTGLTCKYLFALVFNSKGGKSDERLASHFINNIKPLYDVMVPFLKANKIISSPLKRARETVTNYADCDRVSYENKRQRLVGSDGVSTFSISSDPASLSSDPISEDFSEDNDVMGFQEDLVPAYYGLWVNHVHPRSPVPVREPVPVTELDIRGELATPWDHTPMHIWIHQQLDQHNHPRGKNQY